MFHFHHTLSTLLVYFLVLSASCHAIPTPYTLSRIFQREDGSSSGVQMVTTITHIPTEAGNFIETCNIVLTPITGDSGEDMVREERTCTISLDSSSRAPPSTTATRGKVGALPVLTLTPPAPSPTAVSVKGVSSVPNPDFTGSPAPKQPTHTHSKSKQPSSSTASAKSSSNTNQSNPLSVPPAAAAAADAAESPFDPPGKKLAVLPIGLGIFAAISVIGLISVAIVTYERTKHRKNFRKRKLAEAGADMGYGGMAQVT